MHLNQISTGFEGPNSRSESLFSSPWSKRPEARNSAELGLIPANTSDWDPATFDPSQLTDDREGALLGLLADYPRVVASAAELREPHRIARYIEEVATSYHSFYAACRVLPQGDEPVTELNIARLWLCAATRQVIFNGLELLGVSAPDRM